MVISSADAVHHRVSETINRTLFVLVTYCALCITTAFSPDNSFIEPGGGIRLPIVSATVEAKAFLIFAPIGLLLLFTHLQVYLSEARRASIESHNASGYLFELPNPVARCISGFAAYWLTPLTLLAIGWKGLIISGSSLLIPVSVFWLMLQGLHAAFTLVERTGDGLSRVKSWRVFTASMLIASASSIILSAHIVRGARLARVDLRGQVAAALPIHSWEGADLVHANLSDANFSGISLRFANLQYGVVVNTNLRESDLSSVNLQRADLSRSDLRDSNVKLADLRYAILTRSIFEGSDLQASNMSHATALGADFTATNLTNAILESAMLTRSKFDGAILVRADFSGAILRGAFFRAADLQGADLTDSDLTGADLRESNLQGADLSRSLLTSADLIGANLTSVELQGSDLAGASLFGTIGLKCGALQSARSWSDAHRPDTLACGSPIPAVHIDSFE